MHFPPEVLRLISQKLEVECKDIDTLLQNLEQDLTDRDSPFDYAKCIPNTTAKHRSRNASNGLRFLIAVTRDRQNSAMNARDFFNRLIK